MFEGVSAAKRLLRIDCTAMPRGSFINVHNMCAGK
jgi:hypothetical protein